MLLTSLLAHAGHDHAAPEATLIHALTAVLVVTAIAITFMATRSKPVRVAVTSAVVIAGVVVTALL
jgi:hypothetical protein